MDRQSGKTTRIVDSAIQEFFTNRKVELSDHINSDLMGRFVLQIFLRRLLSEHGIPKSSLNINYLGKGTHFISLKL